MRERTWEKKIVDKIRERVEEEREEGRNINA